MKLVLQHTTGAFSGDIPEHAWRDGQEFRKVKTARTARSEAISEMKRICGPNAWDRHYRLVNAGALPIRLTATIECYGSYHAHEHHDDCAHKAEVVWMWEPGESEPPMPHQEGWHGSTCPMCYRIDRAWERRQDAQFEREVARRGYD